VASHDHRPPVAGPRDWCVSRMTAQHGSPPRPRSSLTGCQKGPVPLKLYYRPPTTNLNPCPCCVRPPTGRMDASGPGRRHEHPAARGLLTTWVPLGRTGGEQAANTLQPGDSSRHATTANAKVRGAIEGWPLVTRWRCLCSHGSYQRRPCDTLPHRPSRGGTHEQRDPRGSAVGLQPATPS